ncbi:efflux transporter outer membrane subunit [Piscinibacter sp.]|uniref:efflux transporter outer membrane subunit n=1 Tax=Piscinibacter sp. TaxID=1903157 RepID=UPI002F417587
MNHNSLCPRARQRAGADASEARRDEPAPNPPRETQRSVPGALLTAATMVGAVLATAALLAGCASSAGVAPSSHTLLTATQAGASADAAATPWPASQWWAAWGDPELSALIDKALARQPSLQTVQARLVQAQAAVDAAGAARAPQVNGSLALTDQRFSQNGLVPPSLAGAVRWNNSAQIDASWELDLFGRQRAALDAAIGQLRAAEADGQAARVLLAGNVATAYVNLARLIDTRALSQQALQQREQVLALVRQRIGAGLDSNVELRQAEGFIAQTQVELEALDEAIARSRHALAELTGDGPHAADALAPQLATVTATPLPQTLSADLLGRRADLVAQRWRVEAASKDVAVARAQFYPNVNLVAFVGLSSIGLDRFVKSGSETYGVGPAVRLPIFEGGRLRANLASRNAEVDVAIDGYNAALLRALREVADELASLQSLERQQQSQTQALQSAEAAFDLALQRYRSGLGNFLVVLTAETNVLAQRRAAAELKARQLGAEVALTRALGGGYPG